MRSRDDFCLIVNGVRKRTQSLIARALVFFVAHIMFSAVFLGVQFALTQSASFCSSSQIFNSLFNSRRPSRAASSLKTWVRSKGRVTF